MTRLRQTITNFSSGEISPELLARGDIAAYENGASRLRNVTILPTGGVTRRAGLRYLATVPAFGRLIPFEFPQQSGGLLVISNMRIDIFINGVYLNFISGPWTLSQLSQLTWTQSSDQLIIMHPDVSPRRLVRVNATTYTLNEIVWTIENNVTLQPYFKYANQSVTVTPSATSGSITVTASAGVFTSGLVGGRMRIGGREISVTAVASATSLTATTIQNLITNAPTTNWQEPAFSASRGYPITACFHQERLVFGGSRDIPNRIYMSQIGDIWNFNKNTGIDTDAIEFGIVSDNANSIRGMVSGQHLQVFTNSAEYMISGDPMTPSRVQIRRQTRVGSMTGRYIPPQTVEGSVLFMARNGQELRRFSYKDSDLTYTSNDIGLLARHMLINPIDQTYDFRRRILYVLRSDGRIATLTTNPSEDINAWSLYETNGIIHSIAISADEIIVLTQRGSQFFLERFDESVRSDASITLTNGTAQTTWTGLSHLNGQTVSIVADGVIRANQTISGGTLTISPAANTIEVGLAYRHIVEPLPPSITGNIGDSKAVRLVEATFRLQSTSALRLDVGRGARNIPLLSGQNAILSTSAPLNLGDISVSAFGWHTDMTKPLWLIDQDFPVPFTLLGVKTEIKRND
jgi:hypothetical protein